MLSLLEVGIALPVLAFPASLDPSASTELVVVVADVFPMGSVAASELTGGVEPAEGLGKGGSGNDNGQGTPPA